MKILVVVILCFPALIFATNQRELVVSQFSDVSLDIKIGYVRGVMDMMYASDHKLCVSPKIASAVIVESIENYIAENKIAPKESLASVVSSGLSDLYPCK